MFPKRAIQEFSLTSKSRLEGPDSTLIKMPTKKPSLKRPQSMGEYTEQSCPIVSPLTATEEVTKCDWCVNDGAVPTLPFMYPLQAHVHSDLAPSVIASNVENALRVMSVTAEFNNERAICHAQTMDGVNFTIQMFSNHKGSTIVEVHRTSAPKFGFQTIVQTIFRASTMRDLVLNASDFRHPPAKRRKVVMQQPSWAQKSDETVKTSLDRVTLLLRKDRLDANRLGTESLVFLTDRHRVCEEVVLKTAKAIFLSDNYEENKKVGDIMYNLITQQRLAPMNDDSSKIDENEDDCVQMLKQRIRDDVLQVFSQCLGVLGSSVPEQMTRLFATRWFSDEMLNVLQNDMCSATCFVHGAHVAHTAVQCLRAMMACCPSLQSKLRKEDGLLDAVKGAFHVGRFSHERLSSESKQIMVTLSLCA